MHPPSYNVHAFNMGIGEYPWHKHVDSVLLRRKASLAQPWPSNFEGLWEGALSESGKPPLIIRGPQDTGPVL